MINRLPRGVALEYKQRWSGAYEVSRRRAPCGQDAPVPLDVLLDVRLELTSAGCHARAGGTVRMGEVICAPARARLWLVTKRQWGLRLRIWYRSPDGSRFRLDGSVRPDGSAPAWSLSRLRGVVSVGSRPVGRVEVRLDLRRDLLRLMRSVRLTLG